MRFTGKRVLIVMSILHTSSSGPYASSEYIGEPGVYYDSSEDTSLEVTDPATSISNTPSSFLKDPSVKLLWLLVSSMVAVQEGNCRYCPTHNGIYPNVANCKCYFKCINGTPIQKWCPPGQKFDVMSMACTFPSKTICAASLMHLLPSLVSNYQQGGNNNAIQQMPHYQKNQGGNGNLHITLALQKPNGNGGGYGGNMQMPGNMMDMMQMMMMMMQQQGMNPNMMMNYNQNMMMNQQNSMNYQQNMMNQQNMNMNNMQPNMMMNNKYMNQNMNMGNNMNQNMNMGNNMNQNMNMGNMDQNMNMGNMMNQNMNMGDQQNMMNQNMGNNQNMMDQNMMQTDASFSDII